MRQKTLCALLVMLGAQWAAAQQFPVFKEAPPVDPSATAPAFYGPPANYPVPAAPYYPYAAPPYYPVVNYPSYPPYAAPQGVPPGFPSGPGFAGPPPSPPGTPSAGPQQAAPLPPELPEMPAAPPGPPMPPAGIHADYVDHADHADPHHGNDCGHHWWVSVDYLSGWVHRGPLNAPLATTGSAADFPAGAVGQPGTVVRFGGPIDFGMQSGIRAEAGLWLDPDQCLSVDVGGFYLFPTHQNLDLTSDGAGNPVIARPIILADTGEPSAELVSFPGLLAGSTSVRTSTETYGVEFNGRLHMYTSPRCQVEALAGFRFLSLREGIQVTDRLTPLTFIPFNGDFLAPGDQLTDFDSFTTTNRFYGFQLGTQVRREFGPFYLGQLSQLPFHFNASAFAKVAIGGTTEDVNIAGRTTAVTAASGTQVLNGGILALATNIGDHNRSVFGIVPEFGVTVAFDIGQHLRLQAGYSFLLWNAVARPGAQIDRAVNPTLIPSDPTFGLGGGPARPAFVFHDDVFWIHNFFVGTEIRY